VGEAIIKLEERYTYGDYKSWDDNLRWELIDGEAFCMTPGPGVIHQSLSAELAAELRIYFKGKECRVLAAPLDVVLSKGNEPEDEIDTVVQPDIMIICDKSKIRYNGIKGAPDVIIEILSPSSTRRDLDDKFRLYERAGVKEYVIVDPLNRIIYAHRRDSEGPTSNDLSSLSGGDKRFAFRKVYGADDVLEFGLFPDLKIPLSSVWGDIRDLPVN